MTVAKCLQHLLHYMYEFGADETNQKINMQS